MRAINLSAAGWRTSASFFGIAALTLVAGCVAPTRVQAPPPAPAPVARPAPAPRPMPLAADWRDWPYTPGTWTYRREAGGSVASFGLPATAAVFTLRCHAAAHQVSLSRNGTAITPLTVRTTSVTRAIPVRPADAMSVVATLTATDPLLEAMGFSRGRFVIDQPGLPSLVIPSWAEIERVTEDCRG